VDLSWNADTSPVLGYYVYRGGQSGGPYLMISPQLQTGTSYTDASVVSGQTYYYVVTALGPNSLESAYSNQAVATIP
jgi:fibronectin type 3 domain-containing protein